MASSRRGEDVIWFKSNLPNGYAWLSNFWPLVSPAALHAVYTAFPSLAAPPHAPSSSSSLSASSALFIVGSVEYATVEHYYQSSKFPLDPSYASSILHATSAQQALHLATLYTHSSPLSPPPNWQQRSTVMLYGLRGKYGFGTALGEALLGTGDGELWEEGKRKGGGWAGKGGELGKLLMQVRGELRQQRQAEDALEGGG